MYSTINTNHTELAARLAKKYEKDKVIMSGGSTESWLPCYHDIGTFILKQQPHPEDKFLRSLSRQLEKNFPYTAPYRFSSENLRRMKEYVNPHAPSPDLARWEATFRPNWHGLMPSNFQVTLPHQMKEEARSIFKNTYRIPLPANVQNGDLSKLKESDLEKAFVDNIGNAMASLGTGFNFTRSQFKTNSRYGKGRCDLLFYQDILRCHVIIDFKIGPFKVRDIQQMELYLQSIERELRGRDDQAPIGIFLCRKMDEMQIEGLLKEVPYPIGVATYCF